MPIKAKKAKLGSPEPRIFKNSFPYVPCDVHNCYSQANWKIGSPRGPAENCLNLCGECVDKIIGNIPDELKETSGEPVKFELLESQQKEETPKKEVPNYDFVPDDAELYDPDDHPCPECGKIFKSPQALNGHITAVHKKKGLKKAEDVETDTDTDSEQGGGH